jgi:polysaccharide chain length determinant protein (PEP-CTERM system associated)
MHEILQEFITYLRSMWRYRWYTMILAWIISIAGWTYVSRMPDQYTASARVHVDTESVLRPLMRGLTIEPNVTQRLSLMSRTLLSRPNMEKLARLVDMDIEATSPTQMDALLKELTSGITLGSAGRDANFYTLGYTSTNPVLAKDVVQNLLNILSESTLGQARENSDTAQRFLQDQIKQYEGKLSEAEKNLEDFKRKNRSLMPTLGQGYFATLQSTEANLEESRLQLQEAVRTRDELKRQLTGEEPVFGIASNSSSTPILRSALDVRIHELEKQRDELLLQYTDQHPQVVSIQQTIETLQKQKLANANADIGSRDSDISLDKNPVYQQIRIALAQAEAKVSGLTVRVQEYEKKVRKLKRMVNQIPEVENELKRLEQRYNQARTKYNDFLERQETAKLSEEVEQAGNSVRIKVIDPPHVPNTPTGPDRLLFYSAVLLLSIAVGIGLAFIMSQLRPVVHDTRTLRKLTGLPIYGSVSRVWTPQMLQKKKIEYGGYMFVGLLLLTTYSVFLIYLK